MLTIRSLRRMRAILASLATMALAACEHTVPVDPGSGLQPTFSSIQSNILTNNCAVSGCHVGSTAPHGLDLSAGNSYAKLVGVASAEVPALQRVTAGNADSSYLVIKIEGSARMAPGTARMPLGRAPLTSEQIAAVRQWISNGAPNN